MTTTETDAHVAGFVNRRVAANVTRLRVERGWSKTTLSTKLGELGHALSLDVLSKVEGTENTPPSRRIDVDDLVALAVAFEVPLARLIEGPDADPSTTATARHLDDGEVRDLDRPVDVRVAITDRERGASPEVLVALTREAFDDGAELGVVLAEAVRGVVALASIDDDHAAEVLAAVRRSLPAPEVYSLGSATPVRTER